MKKETFKLKNHVDKYNVSDLEIDLTQKINDDYAENLFFTNEEGRKLKSYIERDKNGYRDVELEITSWMGSIGAVHYYAKLKDRSTNFTYIEDTKNKSSICGYGTRGVPDKYKDLNLTLVRPVTKKDVEHDKFMHREDYLTVKMGRQTRGFWTETAAIITGKKVFNALFKGKWKLTVDSYSGNKDEVIYLE